MVFVTGGCRGIGRGTVEVALALGWSAVAADISGESELPAGAEFQRCDVTEAASVQTAIAAVVERHGRLDGVHANAGISDWEPFLEMSASTYRKTMGVNLDGMVLTVQLAARAMVELGGGAIVLTSSVRSIATSPDHAAYGATKGAANGLVTGLAAEFGAHGIRINAVLPGAIDTPMSHAAADKYYSGDHTALVAQMGAATPLGRLGTPQEVGEVVMFLLSSRSSFVHGALVTVDGGLLARRG